MGLFNIKFEDTGKYDYDTLISLQEAWAIYGPCRLRYSRYKDSEYFLDIIDYDDRHLIYNVQHDEETLKDIKVRTVDGINKDKDFKFICKL
jgi:hypothetical protein